MNLDFKQSLFKTAACMGVLTFISKIIGLAREIVLATYFGTSYVVDAYVMASTILSTLFGGIIIAISTAYLPIFSDINEKEGKKAGDTFTSEIINLMILITLTISFIGIIFSEQLVMIFASKFTGQTAALTSYYVKIIFIYIIFYAVSGILEANLHYKGIFLPQVVSGYLISACIIAAVIVSAHTSIYLLAFGLLIGNILNCIALWLIAAKKGYKYEKTIEYNKYSKRIVKLALPVFIGSYITYINLFVDKTLASGLGEGSISALNYAGLLNTMIIGVTIGILSTIIYPKLVQTASVNDDKKFSDIVESGLYIVLIIALPCALGASVYSKQIIQIIYERGAFDVAATTVTGNVFMYYAFGMIFLALNDFIVRIYYSVQNMKTPMVSGAISVGVNICLSLILVNYMQQSGLALATSIAAACNTIILGARLSKITKRGIIRLDSSKLVKIISASLISIISSYLVYRFILIFLIDVIYVRILQLLIVVCVAVAIYLILLKFLGVEEVSFIENLIRKNKVKIDEE